MKLPPAAGWLLSGALVAILLYGTWPAIADWWQARNDRAPPPVQAAALEFPASWPLAARSGWVVPLKMRPVSRDESPCVLSTESALAIVCNERVISLAPRDVRNSHTSDEWQSAEQWREGTGNTFIIDSPAGEFWCGRMQAYTGKNEKPLDWIDAIVVAPIGAGARGGAFWGINDKGEARCEDLWWSSKTQLAIMFLRGLQNGAESWHPIPASVSPSNDPYEKLRPPAQPPSTAPLANMEDSSTARLSMSPVSRDASPCKLDTDAEPVVVCNGKTVTLDTTRTGFPTPWLQLASRFRERPVPADASIIDSPAGKYWCGRVQAYTGPQRELPGWIDVIVVVPVDPSPGARPFWAMNTERQAQCEDLWWNTVAPAGIVLGIKYHYGKVEGTERWYPVPPEDPFRAPVPMRKVSRDASPCRLGTQAPPAIVCNGRAIPLTRQVGYPNPWEPATRWQESPDPGDVYIVGTHAGDFWCGRLQAFTAPRGEPRAWVDVIVVAPVDLAAPARATWAVNDEGRARCEDLHRGQGSTRGLFFYYGGKNSMSIGMSP